MKLFKQVKEIRSKSGELHFTRFAILETSIFSIYIHKIYKADKDPFLHSHPWNFFGIILKGEYTEVFSGLDLFWEPQNFYKPRFPFSILSGDRNYFHKILRIDKGPVTSLFFTFGKHKDWFYLLDDDVKVHYSEYRKNKNKYLSEYYNGYSAEDVACK